MKTHGHLAQAYERLGRPENARESLQQAVLISNQLVAINPHSADFLSLLGTSHGGLSAFAAQHQEWDTADTSGHAAVEAIGRALEIQPDDVFYRRQLAGCYSTLATIAAGKGRHNEAVEQLEQATADYQRLFDDGTDD